LPTVLPGTELHKRYANRLVREADTYFSLGLEFDNGRRLEADSLLIHSDRVIFSAFHNLPCVGLSLNELDRISRFFPFIVNLYPKTFLLLGLALRESVSMLFSRFLDHVSTAEVKTTTSLSPEKCRRHLPVFAEQALSEGRVQGWDHLPDIILYESLTLDSGDFPRGRTPGTADLCCLEDLLPCRSDNAVIRKFSYNIPEIIADLKAGVFRKSYPEEPTLVVFVTGKNGTEVTQINEFGRDLLDLSTGFAPIEEIAGDLYRRYGSGMGRESFIGECREAIDMLREMELMKKS
jgi:hypothetical protein